MNSEKENMGKWSWNSFYPIKRKRGEYHFGDTKQKLKECNKNTLKN